MDRSSRSGVASAMRSGAGMPVSGRRINRDTTTTFSPFQAGVGFPRSPGGFTRSRAADAAASSAGSTARTASAPAPRSSPGRGAHLDAAELPLDHPEPVLDLRARAGPVPPPAPGVPVLARVPGRAQLRRLLRDQRPGLHRRRQCRPHHLLHPGKSSRRLRLCSPSASSNASCTVPQPCRFAPLSPTAGSRSDLPWRAAAARAAGSSKSRA